MGVAARRREALVPEGLLDEMGRGATVEGVGVPEPVRGHVFFDADRPGRFPNNPPELAAAKRPVGLLRAKHRIAGLPEARTHFLVAERDKHIPRGGGEENGARLFTLALEGDLTGDLAFGAARLIFWRYLHVVVFTPANLPSQNLISLVLFHQAIHNCTPDAPPLMEREPQKVTLPSVIPSVQLDNPQ